MKPAARNPKISVCVCTYNQEAYISRCLKSILDQSVSVDFEVIVGDDASTDKTAAIVENEFVARYPSTVRLIRQPSNTGGKKNCYDVYSAACGEYIAHIDGDDVMLPSKLQAQFDFLENNINCSTVAHNMRVIDANGIVVSDSWAIKPINKFYTLEELVIAGTFFCHSSKMFRRSAIIYAYREELTIDFFLHIEHAISGMIGYIDRVLGEYRIGVGISAIGSTQKLDVLRGHLVAYRFAREAGVRSDLVDEAEINFRYVQGMMALRAKRYDLYRFLFSIGPERFGVFSRYALFAALRGAPAIAYGLVNLLDRLRTIFLTRKRNSIPC